MSTCCDFSCTVPSFEQPLLNRNGKQACQTNMTKLEEYKVVLEPRGPPVGVEAGGVWSPIHCNPKYQVAVIIPYRDRVAHLAQMLQILHPFLQAQLLDYKVIVVEQSEEKQFNRAKLFNVGFLESKVSELLY